MSTDDSTFPRDTPSPRFAPRRGTDRYHHLSVLRSALQDLSVKHLPKPPSGVLVDFGCGDMPYKPLFGDRVSRYIGIDLPNKRVIRNAAFSEAAEIPNGSARVVLSTQVLEHVEDPGAYLGECFRLLELDGFLVLSTHGYWIFHPDPADYWRWTSEGLKRLIEASGFSIIEFRGLMGLASAALQLLQDALVQKAPGPLKRSVPILMQPLIAGADRLYSPEERGRDACVYVVVATKTDSHG